MKQTMFYTAMYLRLSRDDEDKDGTTKFESNSIKGQRELIRSFIQEQKDMELFDCYVDDGFSGSNFDRPEFKRMISDVEAGRVNCIIVKDLSRFGRDYIEAGRYIQKTFPALRVRFIAITDHYDSFHAESGESNIILPVKNFINDSYCRDISVKVKSQFEVKRKNGECVAAFTVYGYQKDPKDKNHLIPDPYAAENVKKIFAWKMQGLANAAIAKQLNELGILSPREYKKSLDIHYKGGFSGAGKSAWSSAAVKRILVNETYLGHLVQGKTEKVNYKIKKSMEKPKEEWIRVENTHEPIVSEDDFLVVQNLLQADARKSPEMETVNPFMGLLFCGDCKEQMVRRVNRYNGTEKIYYICSTRNRGEGCTRHSIPEETLKELVYHAIRTYVNAFLEQKKLFEKTKELETNFTSVTHYNKEIQRLKQEQDKYYYLCANLYEDLRAEVITKEEFDRLYGQFQSKSRELEGSMKKQELLIQEMFRKGVLSTTRLKLFQRTMELEEIDRRTLCSLVKRIYIYEDKRIEIVFYFMDQYKSIVAQNEAWIQEQQGSERQDISEKDIDKEGQEREKKTKDKNSERSA